MTKKLEVKSAVEKRITNIAGKNVNRHQQQDKSQAEKKSKIAASVLSKKRAHSFSEHVYHYNKDYEKTQIIT